MCNGPVGEGAKRTRTAFSDIARFLCKDTSNYVVFSTFSWVEISSMLDYCHVFIQETYGTLRKT
jgi:hypothetical protein